MSKERLGRGLAGARKLGCLWLSALAVVGPAGCSSASSDEDKHAGSGGRTAADSGQAGIAGAEDSEGDASDGGSAGQAPAASAGEAGDAGAAAVLDAPWDEHSQHLELNCFAFFQGSMLFSADRAELSVEQRQLLDALRQVPPNEECRVDELGCGLAITNDRGRVTQYAVDEFDSFCGLSTPALSYASVAPLLDTLGCKFSLEERPGPLSANAGCFHGLRASAVPTVVHQQLSLSEAHRSYHVELVHCLSGSASLELLGADASVPLAVGMPVESPGPRGACVAFDVEVEAAMVADLVITTTAAFDASDYYFNFR